MFANGSIYHRRKTNLNTEGKLKQTKKLVSLVVSIPLEKYESQLGLRLFPNKWTKKGHVPNYQPLVYVLKQRIMQRVPTWNPPPRATREAYVSMAGLSMVVLWWHASGGTSCARQRYQRGATYYVSIA